MERGRRAIVAHIGGEPAFQRRRVDAGKVRALVDEAALGQHSEEIGFRSEGVGRGGHGRFRCRRITGVGHGADRRDSTARHCAGS